MPRYIPQDLFDDMAITFAMSLTVSKQQTAGEFLAAINRYRTSYPEENFEKLIIDLNDAGYEVGLVANQVCDALFQTNVVGRAVKLFAILTELNELVMREARKKVPTWKWLLGRTLANYKRSPAGNRVARCKANVSLAALTIIEKGIVR
jgi:hypothetical protein